MNSHVVVVGRGIAGLSIAHYLVQRGYQVSIVSPASNTNIASHAAQGISAAKGLLLGRDLLFKAKLDGHERLRRFLSEIGTSAGLAIPTLCGVIEVFRDVPDYHKVRRRVFSHVFTGLFHADIHKKKALAHIQPLVSHLRGDYLGGWHYPNDFWFSPSDLLASLTKSIADAGGRFIDEKVCRLDKQPDGSIALEGENFSVRGQDVILAAGQGCSEILEQSGLTGALPPLRQEPGMTMIAKGVQISNGALVSGRKSLIVHSGTLYFGPLDFQSTSGDEHISTLNSELNALVNVSQEDIRPAYRYGVRLRTADRLPLIKKIKFGKGHIIIATALHRNGFQLSTFLGERVHDLLLR